MHQGVAHNQKKIQIQNKNENENSTVSYEAYLIPNIFSLTARQENHFDTPINTLQQASES